MEGGQEQEPWQNQIRESLATSGVALGFGAGWALEVWSREEACSGLLPPLGFPESMVKAQLLGFVLVGLVNPGSRREGQVAGSETRQGCSGEQVTARCDQT